MKKATIRAEVRGRVMEVVRAAFRPEFLNPLASMILAGKIADGDTVEVSSNKSGLLINGEVVEAEAA